MANKRKKKNYRWKLVGGPMYVDKRDKRYAGYVAEMKKTGVSPDETWSLDLTIALFVLPRLKLFKELTISYPCGMTMDGWYAELDKMIAAFELICSEKAFPTKDEQSKINAGLDSFRKYFEALWW